jgi:hypothetical protein
MGASDHSHRFGPCQRRALSRGEYWCFAPCSDQIETLLRFTGLARIAQVHVHTERTAVDLRGTDIAR